MRVSSTVYMMLTRGDEDIDLLIKGEGTYDPGRLSGPPERCYPPEGEMDIVSIETDDGPWDGELTKEEHERALDQLWDDFEYDEGPEYEPDDCFP